MISCFNVTSIGYSHINAGKVCPDFSSSYCDGERTIITACDGHGGDSYVRSHLGSKFASMAVLRAMLNIQSLSFRKYTAEEMEHNLRLNVLCEWNELVQKDLANRPIRKNEVTGLNDKQIEAIRRNPSKAYGTTLGGAMFYGNRLICIGLGDGGMYLIKNGEVRSAFEEDEDEPVANVTYSLCDENAFEHIKASIFDMRSFDGVLACTDGILAPYRTEDNFKRSFVYPVLRHVFSQKTNDVKSFVRDLGMRSGVGDDVSLSMMVRNNANSKFYK